MAATIDKTSDEAQQHLSEILDEYRDPRLTDALLACLDPENPQLPTPEQAQAIRLFLAKEIISEERISKEYDLGLKAGRADVATLIVQDIQAQAAAAFIAKDDEKAGMLRDLAGQIAKARCAK
jgi:hypothetical protein